LNLCERVVAHVLERPARVRRACPVKVRGRVRHVSLSRRARHEPGPDGRVLTRHERLDGVIEPVADTLGDVVELPGE
jgi:hypothetical protein